MVSPLSARPDAAPIVALEGAPAVRRWLVGGLEILGIGLLVPVGILLVGLPVVLVVRLLIELAERL